MQTCHHFIKTNYNFPKLRVADNRQLFITGPQQAPTQSCQNVLQNGIFKDQLAIFLLKEWQENQYGPILDKNKLIVSHGGNCICFAFNEVDFKMTVGHPAHIQGSHEEADTLLAFHAANATGNVVIRTSGTDVIIILLGMLGRHQRSHRETSCSLNIMECGSGNNHRHINVTSIATALESTQKELATVFQQTVFQRGTRLAKSRIIWHEG